MKRKKSNGRCSLVALARTLDAGGFDEECACIIQRYYARRTYQVLRRQRAAVHLKRRMSEIAKTLTDEQRWTIGKFISCREAMAFDAGMRLGLLGEHARYEEARRAEEAAKTCSPIPVPSVEGIVWPSPQETSDNVAIAEKVAEPYGRCPMCGAPGASRERRFNGNDICEKGHSYPSRDALQSED